MNVLKPGACWEQVEEGVARPDIYFLYLGDKVQCMSLQQTKTKQTIIGVENFEE